MSLIKRERRTAWPVDTMWSEDWFDQAFRDMFRDFLSSEGQLGKAFEGMSNLMRVEEFVEGDTCVIRAELPGIDPDKDVELTVADGMLRIHAQRRVEEKTEDKGYMRHELRFGTFTRTLPLPEGASDTDITASYKDGMLEIRIPVVERSAPQPTKIQISKA